MDREIFELTAEECEAISGGTRYALAGGNRTGDGGTAADGGGAMGTGTL
jgi:hypothetical protein